MADNLTKAQRSYCMSRVRGKDTLLEKRVRSALHAHGLRFRKHVAGLPGKPDVVFPTEMIAIFIDGDFWHGWRFPRWKEDLSRFWQDKIEKNRQRDRRNFRRLRGRGWYVIRLWQHELEAEFDGALARLLELVQNRRDTLTTDCRRRS